MLDCSAKLLTLPARELRRLELLFKDDPLLRDAFFLRVVVPLEGVKVSPCDMTESDLCIVESSIMDTPLCAVSKSSVNLPWFCATDCDSGEDRAGLPGVAAKSVAMLALAGWERNVLVVP